jgi:hypothetical protein
VAVVLGLLCAGIVLLLAMVVGLIALYKWAGLALDAGVLIVLAAALVGMALWLTRSRDARSPVETVVPAPTTDRGELLPARSNTQAAPLVQPLTPSRAAFARADDLIGPPLVLLDRYLRWPITDRPATPAARSR